MKNNEKPNRVVHKCSDISPLLGNCIQSYYLETGYWHFSVCLATTTNKTIEFLNIPTDVAKFFEVFPIDFKLTDKQDLDYKNFEKPLTITSVEYLWRSEWLESADSVEGLVGAAPNYAQDGGIIGSVPIDAKVSCDVVAGLKINGVDGGSVLVYTPIEANLNTNIAIEVSEIDEVLANFTIRSH